MILILIDLINIPIFCQSGKSDQLQTLMACSFWRWTFFYMLTSNMIIWKRQINILYKISLSIMAYWESFKKGYISIKTRWTSPRTWPTSKGMHWLSRSWPVSNHGPISQHPSFGGKESRFPGTSFTTPWDDLGNFLSWYCDVTWNSFYSNSLMSLEQASEV